MAKEAELKSAEDKALDLFADMMIEKIEGISKNWEKPWFTDGAMSWPKNLNGREYNGMNSLMLLMHCEKNGYEIPRFCTFNALQKLNIGDKNAELPRVSVNKGERSFPVMLTTFTVVDKDTKEKIRYDDWKALSEDEKQQYNVYPKTDVFRVFNVAQTNLKEARPALWAKLAADGRPMKLEGQQFSFEPMDRMIADGRWICPIKPQYGDKAYYSMNRNEIIVPEKQQFKDGESFYGNLWHEMAHSTGASFALGRLKPETFGTKDYAKEELTAELTAALTAQRYGITKNLKDDSAAYLKAWLTSLRESPQFIKTTLMDVKKASSMITMEVDKIQMEIDAERGMERSAGVSAGSGLDTGGVTHTDGAAVSAAKAAVTSTRELPVIGEEEIRKYNQRAGLSSDRGFAKGVDGDDAGVRASDVAKGFPAIQEYMDKQARKEAEKRAIIDDFMTDYYWGARRENDFRMSGFENHDGRLMLRLNRDDQSYESHYLISHYQDTKGEDHFHMHFMDGGQQIGRSLEMPPDRNAAYSFLRMARDEQDDYESSRQEERASGFHR